MHKVLVRFTDLQDDRYAYNPGDVFPREGLKVSAERIAELAGSNNKRGRPVIEAINESVMLEPKESIGEEKPADETVLDMSEPKEPIVEEKPDEKPRRGRRKKNAD